MNSRMILFLLLIAGNPNVLADDTVDLKFKWPDGLVLKVDREFERLVTVGDKNETISSECTYLCRTARKGDKHFISFTDFKETTPETPPSSRDPLVLLEYLSRRIETFMPTIVVDSNAQPVSLEELESVKSKINEEINNIDSRNDPQFAAFKKMLCNDQAIQIRVLEDWNRMIQVWSGNSEVELGTSFQMTGQTGEAAGKSIENIYTYSINKGPKPGTVLLTIVQKPEKDKCKGLLDGMLGGDVFKMLGIPTNSEIIFENRFETVADPSTLIPLTYKKVKIWGAYTGEKRIFKGRIDSWKHTFTKIKKRRTGG